MPARGLHAVWRRRPCDGISRDAGFDDHCPGQHARGSSGPDDAAAYPQPLSAGQLGNSYKLPDGYVMVWDRPSSLTANTAYGFSFHLLDTRRQPAADMQLYMGMTGHAAFVKTDGTVFAHTHPEGSAAMAALMLANRAVNTRG